MPSTSYNTIRLVLSASKIQRRRQLRSHLATADHIYPVTVSPPFAVRVSTMTQKGDWSASQYLKYKDERTRPARELLGQVPLERPARVVDLGCGPGNSTAVLAERFASSKITGMDSSPDMIATAKKAMPALDFSIGDLRSYQPEAGVDLFYSNAVFQWLSQSERVQLVTRLLEAQSSGGVIAFQVPDNMGQPSHVAMREAAVKSGSSWTETLESSMPKRDIFQTPQELYDVLVPMCSSVNIWSTIYQHALDGHEAIIEWVKGTGLRPFLDPLNNEQQQDYLADYLDRLKAAYPLQSDGKVLLPYPRLFVVAVKA